MVDNALVVREEDGTWWSGTLDSQPEVDNKDKAAERYR